MRTRKVTLVNLIKLKCKYIPNCYWEYMIAHLHKINYEQEHIKRIIRKAHNERLIRRAWECYDHAGDNIVSYIIIMMLMILAGFCYTCFFALMLMSAQGIFCWKTFVFGVAMFMLFIVTALLCGDCMKMIEEIVILEEPMRMKEHDFFLISL